MSFISFVQQNSSQSQCEFKASIEHRRLKNGLGHFVYAQIQKAFRRLKSIWIKYAFDCSIYVWSFNFAQGWNVKLKGPTKTEIQNKASVCYEFNLSLCQKWACKGKDFTFGFLFEFQYY